jgi:hypothetical protein
MLIGFDSARLKESRAIAQQLPSVRSEVAVISKSQKMPAQKEQVVVIFYQVLEEERRVCRPKTGAGMRCS